MAKSQSQSSHASIGTSFPMSTPSGHKGKGKACSKSSPGVDNSLRRTTVACSFCRSRKTKCLGGDPCQRCIISNQSCVYIRKRKRVVLEEDWKAMKARLRAYEAAGEGRVYSPELEDQVSVSSEDEEPNGIDSNITNKLVEGVARMTVSPTGHQQFLGPGSSTTIMNLLVATFNTSEENVDTKSIDFDTWRAPWPSRRSSTEPLPMLPPYDFAKRLYAAQYAYIGTIFSFLPPQKFEERLQEVYRYSQNPDLANQEACLKYCELLMIFAFGDMYSVNQWIGYDGPPGFAYFTRAMKHLPDIHEEGSVLFVETLSLLGYFMQNLNRRDAAFLYIGLGLWVFDTIARHLSFPSSQNSVILQSLTGKIAVRMAISLGLHEEVSDTTLDDVSREHRRRLWWSVYSMDRILCVKSGNPFSIADEDIGVSLPSRLPEEAEISSATVLLHYTQLSQILGKIMVTIYRKTRQTKSNLVSSVQTIMNDLSLWLQHLPVALQFDFTRLDRDISRESVSLYLHYYQCINMTARPLLFHVVQSRLKNRAEMGKETSWRIGLSATTVSMIEQCVDAARSCTMMMAASSKQNLWATFGFMDGEHAFSAALVLVMVNIAFAINSRDSMAMDTAMSVLQSMAEKGNGHIRSRYRLLLNLQSMIRHEGTSDSDPVQTPLQPTIDHNLYTEGQSSENAMPGPHSTTTLGMDNANLDSGMELIDEGMENGFANAVNGEFEILIPEAYENEDLINMDIDYWAQWTAETARNWEEFPGYDS